MTSRIVEKLLARAGYLAARNDARPYDRALMLEAAEAIEGLEENVRKTQADWHKATVQHSAEGK